MTDPNAKLQWSLSSASGSTWAFECLDQNTLVAPAAGARIQVRNISEGTDEFLELPSPLHGKHDIDNVQSSLRDGCVITAFAVSQRSRRVAAAVHIPGVTDPCVYVLQLPGNDIISTIRPMQNHVPSESASCIENIALSRFGDRLLIVEGDSERYVSLWYVDEAKPIDGCRFPFASIVHSIKFAPASSDSCAAITGAGLYFWHFAPEHETEKCHIVACRRERSKGSYQSGKASKALERELALRGFEDDFVIKGADATELDPETGLMIPRRAASKGFLYAHRVAQGIVDPLADAGVLPINGVDPVTPLEEDNILEQNPAISNLENLSLKAIREDEEVWMAKRQWLDVVYMGDSRAVIATTGAGEILIVDSYTGFVLSCEGGNYITRTIDNSERSLYAWRQKTDDTTQSLLQGSIGTSVLVDRDHLVVGCADGRVRWYSLPSNFSPPQYSMGSTQLDRSASWTLCRIIAALCALPLRDGHGQVVWSPVIQLSPNPAYETVFVSCMDGTTVSMLLDSAAIAAQPTGARRASFAGSLARPPSGGSAAMRSMSRPASSALGGHSKVLKADAEQAFAAAGYDVDGSCNEGVLLNLLEVQTISDAHVGAIHGVVNVNGAAVPTQNASARRGTQLTSGQTSSEECSLAHSPSLVATIGQDHTLRIWDCRKNVLLCKRIFVDSVRTDSLSLYHSLQYEEIENQRLQATCEHSGTNNNADSISCDVTNPVQDADGASQSSKGEPCRSDNLQHADQNPYVPRKHAAIEQIVKSYQNDESIHLNAEDLTQQQCEVSQIATLSTIACHPELPLLCIGTEHGRIRLVLIHENIRRPQMDDDTHLDTFTRTMDFMSERQGAEPGQLAALCSAPSILATTVFSDWAHHGSVCNIAFSPHASHPWMASYSAQDGTVLLWQLQFSQNTDMINSNNDVGALTPSSFVHVKAFAKLSGYSICPVISSLSPLASSVTQSALKISRSSGNHDESIDDLDNINASQACVSTAIHTTTPLRDSMSNQSQTNAQCSVRTVVSLSFRSVANADTSIEVDATPLRLAVSGSASATTSSESPRNISIFKRDPSQQDVCLLFSDGSIACIPVPDCSSTARELPSDQDKFGMNFEADIAGALNLSNFVKMQMPLDSDHLDLEDEQIQHEEQVSSFAHDGTAMLIANATSILDQHLLVQTAHISLKNEPILSLGIIPVRSIPTFADESNSFRPAHPYVFTTVTPEARNSLHKCGPADTAACLDMQSLPLLSAKYVACQISHIPMFKVEGETLNLLEKAQSLLSSTCCSSSASYACTGASSCLFAYGTVTGCIAIVELSRSTLDSVDLSSTTIQSNMQCVFLESISSSAITGLVFAQNGAHVIATCADGSLYTISLVDSSAATLSDIVTGDVDNMPVAPHQTSSCMQCPMMSSTSHSIASTALQLAELVGPAGTVGGTVTYLSACARADVSTLEEDAVEEQASTRDNYADDQNAGDATQLSARTEDLNVFISVLFDGEIDAEIEQSRVAPIEARILAEQAEQQKLAYESERRTLKRELERIKRSLDDMLATNVTAPELERLDRKEFLIDVTGAALLAHTTSRIKQKIYTQAEHDISLASSVREYLVDTVVNSMQVQQARLHGLTSSTQVYNFSIPKLTEQERIFLEKATILRRIEQASMLEQQRQRANIHQIVQPGFTEHGLLHGAVWSKLIQDFKFDTDWIIQAGLLPPSLHPYKQWTELQHLIADAKTARLHGGASSTATQAAKQTEDPLENSETEISPWNKLQAEVVASQCIPHEAGTADKTKEEHDGKPTLEEASVGSATTWEGANVIKLLYHPSAARSPHQKRIQIWFMQALLRAVETEFNRRFDELWHRKQEDMKRVIASNRKIRLIAAELGMDMEVTDPDTELDFQASQALEVTVNDIGFEPYVSDAELRRRLEEQEIRRRKAEENHDDAPERALQEMMYGTLEKQDAIAALEAQLGHEEWMDELSEEAMSEEQRHQYSEYKIKLSELEEQKEIRRQTLDAELRKLTTEVKDITNSFDQKLDQLRDEYLVFHEAITSQRLYILRIAQSINERDENVQDEARIVYQHAWVDDLRGSAGAAAEQLQYQVQQTRDKLQQLQQHDRHLERNFRDSLREQANAPVDPDTLRILFNLFRQRTHDAQILTQTAQSIEPGELDAVVKLFETVLQQEAESKRIAESHRQGFAGQTGMYDTGPDFSVHESGSQRKDGKHTGTNLVDMSVRADDFTTARWFDPLQDIIETAEAVETAEKALGLQLFDRDPYRKADVKASKPSWSSRRAAEETKARSTLTEEDLPDDWELGVTIDTRVWEAMQQLRSQKISSEIEICRLNRKLFILENGLKHITRTFARRGVAVDKLSAQFSDALSSRDMLNCDLVLLTRMRQGYDEVLSPDVPVPDYANAMLIPKQVVLVDNARIKYLSALKVGVLERHRDFRQELAYLAWELRYMRGLAQDSSEYFTDLQLLRVTKTLQDLIQGGDVSDKQRKNVLKLEARGRHLQQTHQRQIAQLERSLQKLNLQKRKKQQKNEELMAQLRQVEADVAVRDGIMKARTAGRSADTDPVEQRERKLRSIVKRRKLVDMIKLQRQDIEMLTDELQKLRERSFPSFAKHDPYDPKTSRT